MAAASATSCACALSPWRAFDEALPANDRTLGQPVTIESIEPDADISVVVTAEESDDDDAPASFTVTVVADGTEAESFTNVTVVPGDRNIETVVNAESKSSGRHP